MLTRRLITQSKTLLRSIPVQLSQLKPYSTKSTFTASEDAGYVPPDLNGLESRWPNMSEFDQTDLIEHLQERQALPWTQLTLPEKKALYYIYYGAWGPRSKVPVESMAATVLKRLSVFLAIVGLAVAGYNWAVDVEEEQRVNDVIEKVKVLKLEELKAKEEGQRANENAENANKSKRWWFF